MKKILFPILCLFNCLLISAQDSSEDILPKNDWVIRLNAGSACVNVGGTGESAWKYDMDQDGWGFQYGIDVMNYREYMGYGIIFRHYMHHLPNVTKSESAINENVRILYVAPQFSCIDESGLLKGLLVNLDLGIGYAHYLSDGVVDGDQNFSLPCSGLGINANVGFEYRFCVHWGVKISASAEFYHFKDMHKDKHITDSFDERTKLNLFGLTPQLGLAYHF